MPQFLNTQDSDFPQKLQIILKTERGTGADISHIVSEILADVRHNGDEAVLKYTQKFDNLDATLDGLVVTQADLEHAEKILPQDIKDALLLAQNRIHQFHYRTKPKHDYYEDDTGTELGIRYTPIDAVGVYIPGGSASYPSSVLMNIVPAKVGGVGRIVAVVPAPQGKIHPAVLYALKIAGADEIYKIGGAQAIAALAYGTQMIKPVDKITGPGNAFVAQAKRQVYGTVGIDAIAGPSEILIIADETADDDYVAMDLLSQAEHDVLAQSVLITPSQELADKVVLQVNKILETLPRTKIASKSWTDYGVVIIVKDIQEATDISDKFAPEHLELCVAEPDMVLPFIHHAGAIFMGHHTPEAIGDYIAGPNHVLPTGRTARFSSGLATIDFMKRTTMVKCSPESIRAIGDSAVTLAQAEGLDAHAQSVSLRLR